MVTKQECVWAGEHGAEFEYLHGTYARSKELKRVRVSGKCKTWKTRPDEFQLPVKYGMYESLYITHGNAKDFQLTSGSKERYKASLLVGNPVFPPATTRRTIIRNPRSDVRIVHNRLLGGWYIVRGPHQTPLGGRFNSKAEAQAHMETQRAMRDKPIKYRRNPAFKHRGKTKTATRETRDNEAIHITYHNTEIVTVHIDGGVTLRSGGWETVTTKRRMNEVASKWNLPYHVYAKSGEWFVYLRDLDQTLPFTSGMHFYPRRRTTHSDPESALTNPRKSKKTSPAGLLSMGWDGQYMLVTEKGERPVEVGVILTSFRGNKDKLVGGDAPHKPASTGHVYTKNIKDGWANRFYPSVYGLKWKMFSPMRNNPRSKILMQKKAGRGWTTLRKFPDTSAGIKNAKYNAKRFANATRIQMRVVRGK